ncbi:GIY-YIG nuclease family protein [Flavobacterium cerinum]|uniref:GIY-YIG nuclease family protein n=1 Tax=Flavobacterium cerinum TaxID=2502784 RepID=A0ABY5ISS2_9FLAO|nr:GIY-YIG nuclease family protein [Flavobacterium cerinum]UUC45897.1 GIY-YIG nuclease family protein [Flavobacterium cerinum]
MYYVYVIYSRELNVCYKGFTMNLDRRLERHLNGGSGFTSRASDWVLVYSKMYETKKEALIEEKRLKKLNRASLERLFQG